MDVKSRIIADIKQVTGDYANLITQPLPVLIGLAQQHGVKSSGSKSKLIGRILTHNNKKEQ